MGINHSLAGLTLVGVLTTGAQAGEQGPTLMETQIGQATALCRAVNAKASTVYNCVNSLPTIRQDGSYMFISQKFTDRAGNILDIPLVTQYAKQPNARATFAWSEYTLDTFLKEKK